MGRDYGDESVWLNLSAIPRHAQLLSVVVDGVGIVARLWWWPRHLESRRERRQAVDNAMLTTSAPVADIARQFGMSPTAARERLRCLRRKGRLRFGEDAQGWLMVVPEALEVES